MRRRPRRPGLAPPCLVVLLVWIGPSPAQEQDGAGVVLDPITVTATEGQGSGMASRTSVDRDDLLGAFQGASLPTILNTIPGVTTETTPGDPSIAVNIRGLQGNGRVVTTIDGARQNFAKSDHGANGTFYADPEMLRSVEVIRGPADPDAAAGAIGGTLALRTVEADDLIDPGDDAGGEFRLRYGTLTTAPTLHVAFAHTLGASSDALLAFTRTQASDYGAGDGTEVAAAETSLSGLAKLSFAPAEGLAYTLSVSKLASSFRTGIYSGIPRDNDMDTTNAVLNAVLDGPGAFAIDATVYRTATGVAQQLLDEASLAPIGPARSYATTTTGLRASADQGFGLGPTNHALILVLDAFRDAVVADDPTAVGGSLTPSGRRSIGSILAQDTVAFPTGTEAIVALRYDSYALESDDGDASGAQVSPAVALRQAVGSALVLHATAARSFRPPTLSEALVNGLHPEPADFYIRPNPNLKPESAVTTEVGATLGLADLIRPGDTFQAVLTAYRNDVTDYIGLVERGTLFDRYLQYDNIDSVRIEGIELEVGYDAGRVFGDLSGQIIEGTNRETGEPVSGIAPNRVVLTGGVRNPAQTLEAGARLTLAEGRQDGVLTSEAWSTIDLFLTRALGAWGTIGLALNNITNETYTPYINTQPSPGFNALASLSLVF